MIILLARSGQMCNQMLSLAAVYSLGLEFHCDVKCPAVDMELKKYFAFDEKVNDGICKVQMYRSKFGDLCMLAAKVARKVFKLNYDKKFQPQKRKNQYFLDWISMLDNKAFCNHVSEIRRFFAIRPEIEMKCKEIMEQGKGSDVITVGVHLRRGDYRTYLNGELYFDDAVIIRWLKHLSETVETSKRLRFALCSNEKIDIDSYKRNGLDVFTPGGSGIEDLCCLSLCDYVMGPPSTFSFWAAMYGNKKRCILDDRNKMYNWSDFRYFEDRLAEGDYIR